MTTGRTEVRCRPTATQQLLLEACLAADADARAAWDAWRERVEIDRIDEESFRHLPLAFHRLKALAPPDPVLEIARGIYRRAWYQNQLLLHELADVLDVLAEHSIDALLLKGASIATRYYPTPATRPMGDLDVLVRHQEASRAVAILAQRGWVPVKNTSVDTLVRLAHGVSLRRGATNLDLHWNALWSKRTADADRQFWDAAQAIVHQGRPAWALSPSDEILHACMHGARKSQNAYSWQPVPLIRWATDAALVLRHGAVDWSRIDAMAGRYHARLQLLDAFRYLKGGLGLPIPGDLLATWADVRSGADRLHYELALARCAPCVFPALPRFRFWSSHRMTLYIEHGAERVDAMSIAERAAGFPAYVAAFVKVDLDTERLRALPGQLARKVIRRPWLLRP